MKSGWRARLRETFKPGYLSETKDKPAAPSAKPGIPDNTPSTQGPVQESSKPVQNESIESVSDGVSDQQSIDNESLWAEALKKLSDKDRQTIDDLKKSSNLDESLASITDFAKQNSRQLQMQRHVISFNNQTIVLRDVMVKLVTWANKFKAAGDIIVNFDPVHLALPWAGMRFILQAITVENEQTAAIFLGLEKTAYLASRCRLYEALYPRSRLVDTDVGAAAYRNLREALQALYVTILQFLATICRWISKLKVSRVATALFDPERISKFIYLCDTQASKAETEAENCEAAVSLMNEQEASKRYDLLHDVLSGMQRPLLRIDLATQMLVDKVQSEERGQILRWLSSIPYEDRHHTACDDRLIHTSAWLFKDPVYAEWLNSSTSTTLWLYGSPGTGKTKIISAVVDEFKSRLSSAPNDEALVYFYCDRNQDADEHPGYVLASLVRQLSAQSESSIPSVVHEAYTNASEKGFSASRLSLQQNRDLLVQLTSMFSQVSIIIDGLDECSANPRLSLIEALDLIMEQSSGLVKIAISSRPDADIKTRFQNGPNLEVEATKNRADIQRFVDQKLAENPRWQSGKFSSSLLQDVRQAVVEKSNGMFQWASVQLNQMANMMREKDVRDSIETLPEGLTGLYEEIYRRIKKQGGTAPIIADHAFYWIMASVEPLTPTALVEAVCQDANEDRVQEIDITFEDVREACCNLLVLHKISNTCMFSHLSVQEYLESHVYGKAIANLTLTKVCLTNVYESSSQDRPTNVPYLSRDPEMTSLDLYAKVYWLKHLQEIIPDDWDERLMFLTNKFLGISHSGTGRYQTWVKKAVASRHHPHYERFNCISGVRAAPAEEISDLPFAICIFGLEPLYWKMAERFGPDEIDISKANASGYTLLWAACFSGCEAIAIDLLKRGAAIPSGLLETASPLKIAARMGHVRIVELLLDDQPDLAQSLRAVDALHEALRWWKSPEIVLLLIDRGVKVDTLGLSKYGTALAAATQSRHEPTVRLLLDKGANPNEDYKGISCLHRAIAHRLLPIVRTLIEYGASVGRKGGVTAVRCPLHTAAECDFPGAISLLLNEGADIDAVLDGHGTPLQVAAANGSLRSVKLLVERGADQSVQGGPFGTARVAALAGNDPRIMKLLDFDGDRLTEYERGFLHTVLATAITGPHVHLAAFCANAGVDVLKADEYGRTILHRQISYAQIYFVASNDALMNLITLPGQDKMGMSPLHHAACEEESSVCEWMIAQGAPLNQLDNHLWTPLHWAVHFHRRSTIKVLLKAGARRDLKDRDGRTPSDLAKFLSYNLLGRVLHPEGESMYKASGFERSRKALASCDGCDKTIFEKRDCFHCIECADYPGFDLCHRCIHDVAIWHPEHTEHQFKVDFTYRLTSSVNFGEHNAQTVDDEDSDYSGQSTNIPSSDTSMI